jgi:hypothetical protein
MAVVGRRTRLSLHRLERLLDEALVPVEPNPEFAGSLRARLVTYHGRGLPSLWVGFAVLATSLLLAAGAIGFLLRLFLGVAGVLLVVNRRTRAAPARQQAG